MKKYFKKGLIALTLMLGMTFTIPQQANAFSPSDRLVRTKVIKWADGRGRTFIDYRIDSNGRRYRTYYHEGVDENGRTYSAFSEHNGW